jgi:multidrug resistance protein
VAKSWTTELKEDVKLLFKNRQLLFLSFAVFVSMLGFGLIMPLLPLYARRFGASGVELGLLTTSFALARIITTFPGGWLADKTGRKPPIITGLFFYSIVMTLYAFSQNVHYLIFLRGLQGAASGLVWPVISTMIGDMVHPKDRSKAMGLYEMTWYLGLAVGPALGGILSAFFGLAMPFYVCGILAFMTMMLVAFTVKETSLYNDNGVSWQGNACKKDFKASFSFLTFYPRVFLGFCIVGFAISFSQSLIQPILSVYADEQLGFSEIAIAMLFTANGLANFVLTLPASTVADRVGRKHVIIFGMLLDGFSTMLIALFSDYWMLFLFMSMRGVGHASSNPSISAMVCGLVPISSRGKVMGIFNMVRNVGLVAGSFFGGLLYDGVSPTAPFWMCALVEFIGFSCVVFMIKEKVEYYE